MITSFDDLRNPIRSVVAAASGVDIDKIIIADQNAPGWDEDLYATVKIYPIRAIGTPRFARQGIAPIGTIDPSLSGHEDIQETVISQMEVMVSCNFINEGARDAAFKMHHGAFRLPVQTELYNQGIGWRYCSDIRDLTNLAQASLQPRHQLDWHIWVETAITYDTEAAAQVPLEISDENENVLSQSTIVVQ